MTIGKDRTAGDVLVTALTVIALVLVLGLPWLVGVVVGAVRLSFAAGHNIGFAGLATFLSQETNPKGKR
jgi:hypothetical protein